MGKQIIVKVSDNISEKCPLLAINQMEGVRVFLRQGILLLLKKKQDTNNPATPGTKRKRGMRVLEQREDFLKTAQKYVNIL
jgi:hypothetical protein